MELFSATDLASFKYSLNRKVTQEERKYIEENRRAKKKKKNREETLSKFFCVRSDKIAVLSVILSGGVLMY